MHRSSPGAAGSRGGPVRVRGRRKAAVLAAGLAVGITGVVAADGPAAQAADPIVINLVTVNDFHGRIEQDGAAAGIARLATAVNQVRAGNPNTVFAAAGDMIGASTFTSFIQQDVPTIEALNLAGLDVSAAGNHEFDQGYDDLINRVLPLADWEYVAANIETTDGAPELPEYWLSTMQGITVGFVGAVTDELPSLVSPDGIANLTIEPPVVAANRVADQLSDGDPANGEADIVVLLVHEGAVDTTLASATNGATRFGKIVNGANDNIDAIVSGHTHLAYNHVIDGRPVISSGQYGEKFSNMVITVDPDTKSILSMTNTVYDMSFVTGQVRTYNYAPDPALVPLVAAATTTANTLGNVALGSTTADFNRGTYPATTVTNGVPGVNQNAENRGAESTLGNLVADVQLWSIRQDADADIAFMNPGGLRANIAFAPDGVVTYREAANVQPFANTLVTLTLTGAQVKKVLEQQWQPAVASRPFLKLGVNKELTYVYDPAGADGNRVTHIELNGAPIDPNGTYRVVANSFLAAGGDNFFELANGADKSDSGKIDLQSMVDWFAEFGTATPDTKQRSVGINLSAPDADGYNAGDPLTINLSSLDFTTNELKSGSVQVSLGGVALGTVPVDPTRILDQNRDEAGRATLTTTVPAGIAGVRDLVVTVPTTGTTARLPIIITKAPSSTTATTSTPKVKAGATLIVFAKTTGSSPVSGTLSVFLDGVDYGDVRYVENDQGLVKVQLKLPKNLAKGAHTVTITYDGNDQLQPSTTTVALTVK